MVFKSSKKKNLALSLGSFSLGVLFLLLIKNSHSSAEQYKYGLIIGLFFLLMGALSFLFAGNQTIIFDSELKQIHIHHTNIFFHKSQHILFPEIDNIKIGYLGKKTNFVEFYYLILELNNNKKVSLFSPGYFYEGSNSRSAMEERRNQLLALMDHSQLSGPV